METLFNGTTTKAKKIEFQMYRKSSSSFITNNYTENWNNRKSYVLIKAVLKQQNKFTNVQGQIESATSITSHRGQATNIFVSAATKQTNINNFHCHSKTATNNNINNYNFHDEPRSQFKVINVCNNFTAQKSISKLQINGQNNEPYVVNNFKNPIIKVRIESTADTPSKYNINKENLKNRSQTNINMKTQKEFVTHTHNGIGGSTHDNFSYQYERKSKKVEFCKTEVHFAAESGRINIVEIDGKPPPTKNFRRRRRHLQKNIISTVPVYENTQSNFLPAIEYPVIINETATQIPTIPTNDDKTNPKNNTEKYITHVDLTTSETHTPQQCIDDDNKDNSEKENTTPKSILKNKPLKPLKSYHLGENIEEIYSTVHNKTIEPLPLQSPPSLPQPLTSTPSIELNNNQSSVKRSNFNKLQNEIILKQEQTTKRIIKPFKPPESVKLLRNTNKDYQQQQPQPQRIPFSNNNVKTNKIHVGETKTVVKIVPNVTNKRLLTNDQKNLLNDRKNREVLDSTNSTTDYFRIDRLKKKNGDNNDVVKNEKNTTMPPLPLPLAPPSSQRQQIVINKIQLPPNTFQTLKSTSLVMNIIKNNLNNNNLNKIQEIPKRTFHFHSILNNNNNSNGDNRNEKLLVSNQLEALKKLYENADEFSDDSEKMNDKFTSTNKKINDDINLLEKDEKCSELSGSWKKVRKIQQRTTTSMAPIPPPKKKSSTYPKQRATNNCTKDVRGKESREKIVRKIK